MGQHLLIVNTVNKNLSLLVLISAMALSFLLYGNNIKGSFVYDDHFFADRQELRSASSLLTVWTEPYLPQNVSSGLFRPLATFSFALNFIIFGSSSASFHIINILLNGVVIFLVFLLVQKLFKDRRLALMSALFFAFLPIHTEAISFIKSRDEILSALFAILSWLLFISATEDEKRVNYKKIFLSAIIFILAVLSKELIIIIPALFLVSFIIRRKPSLTAVFKVGLIFFVVSALYMVLRFKVLGSYAFGTDEAVFVINPIGYVDFWTRIWTAFKIAFIYVSKTFVPFNLSATYHYNQLTMVANPLKSMQTLAGVALAAILIYLPISKKFRLSPMGVGALMFLIPYLVISKFIFKSGDLLAERWMYFSSVGLALIGGYVLYLILKKKKSIGIILLILILSIYSFIVIRRNLVWASDEALFKSMVQTAPQSVQAYANLANFYMKNDRLDEARREAEAGFNIYQEYSPLLNVIGAIAFKDNNYELARTAFLKAIELAPKIPLSYSNLGRLYYGNGEYDKAKEMLASAIKLYVVSPKPTDVFLYSLTLVKLKQYQESIDIINKYFSKNMDNSQVRFIMALNYFKMGNIVEAKKYFDWTSGKTEAEKIKILQQF